MYKVHNSRYYRFIIQQSNYQVNKLGLFTYPGSDDINFIIYFCIKKIFVANNKI